MKNEFASLFKKKSNLTGLIAVLFIPVLYCAAFIWSFWNPVDETDEISVAIVNQDEAVDFNKTSVNFGEEMIDQLKNNESFDWEFVSNEKAKKGLKNSNYYMMIEIPSNFSKKAATVFSEKPEQPSLRYVPHESRNYLISMFEKNGVEDLQQKVSNKLTYSYLEVVEKNIAQMSNGMAEASEGTTKLAKSVTELGDKFADMVKTNPNLTSAQTEQLLTSYSDIIKGATNISERLNEGADQFNTTNLTEENLDLMANPVKLNTDKFTSVPNYGHGFAPFALSLGLFIGAMLISIVFPVREPVVRPKSPLSWFVSKFSIIGAAAIVQAMIADIFLLGILGLDVGSIGYFLLFTIFTSLAFIALIQFIVSVLGEKGRFFVILILIAQITSSGGTFPVDMIPNVLQKVSTYLPMTYSVSGFRALVSNNNYDLMWQNAGFLSIFLFASIAGTFVYFTIKHKKMTSSHEQKLYA